VWVGFVKSTALLLVPVPEDRPLDQFLQFRDKVLAMAQDEDFLDELDRAWPPQSNYPSIGEALLLELRAFAPAVDVANTTASTPTEKAGWFRNLLGRASTAAESVKDLVEKLPPWAKMTITLFRELVELFKRQG
jgi:hypothetical protein